MQYPNVPRVLGILISSKLATLHELDTVYSSEDAYALLEIVAINNHNQRMTQKHFEKMATTQP